MSQRDKPARGVLYGPVASFESIEHICSIAHMLFKDYDVMNPLFHDARVARDGRASARGGAARRI